MDRNGIREAEEFQREQLQEIAKLREQYRQELINLRHNREQIDAYERQCAHLETLWEENVAFIVQTQKALQEAGDKDELTKFHDGVLAAIERTKHTVDNPPWSQNRK